jgi:hypothetical protein
VFKFSVVNIPLATASEESARLEGAIDKYWLDLPNLGRSLIKADSRGAWVEKICATLAEKIGLPVASCELAARSDGLKMIASPTYLLAGALESPGEELLENRFGVNYAYTPDAILLTVESNGVVLPHNYQPPANISTASDLLAGYLIFDSWIGNIDRHAKNWGIQRTLNGRKELLPTYDHGLSLGVRMPDDKLPLDIAGFSGDCRSSIQGETSGALTMNDLADRLLALKPKAAHSWIEKIAAIEHSFLQELFSRLPDGWIGVGRAEFSIDFLVASCDRLIARSADRQ